MQRTPALTREETTNRAHQLFTSGFNCSQASLTALREAFVQTEVPPSIAACFGGGMGSSGGPCGILTGSLLALGLACGYDKPDRADLKTISSALAAELIETFHQHAGNVNCAGLTGRPTEGSAEDRRLPEGTKDRVCLPLMDSWVAFCYDFMASRNLAGPSQGRGQGGR